MSDDDRKQEDATDKRDMSDDREEREFRREDGDQDAAGDEPSGNTTVDDQVIQPDRADDFDTEDVDKVGTGKDEEQLYVPQITLDGSSRLDTVNQVEDPPADRTVNVPQISPNSKDILNADDMEASVLIEAETGTVTIPQFTTNTTEGLTPVEFDDDQLEVIERVQQVQVPQVTVDRCHRIQPFETFLETLPEVSTETTDTETQVAAGASAEEEEAAEAIEISGGTVKALSELETGDEWITGEWPDPLELLFGSEGANVKSDNPVVVLVDDDDLVGVVETVVKRLYREKEGGEPDLERFNTANQIADEERWLSADNRIFTAELPEEEWKKIEGEHQDEWQSIWQNRFDQLFSGQQFGAIVFNRSQIPGPEVTSLPHHPPILVKLEGGIPWKDVAKVFWSSNPEDAQRALTFSQLFDRDANGVARDRWIQILRTADGKFDLATEGDEAASDEHYALKVFVVKWLAEQLWEADDELLAYDELMEIKDYREIEETIPTEQPLQVGGNDQIRPDVWYGSQVFEVEMFFEEADKSGTVAKLQQTVRKYEDVERQIDTINIVVDNLTCLLHLKDLARFKRNHQAWEEDHADIDFYTVDLGQEGLVPVREIRSGIASLFSE